MENTLTSIYIYEHNFVRHTTFCGSVCVCIVDSIQGDWGILPTFMDTDPLFPNFKGQRPLFLYLDAKIHIDYKDLVQY